MNICKFKLDETEEFVDFIEKCFYEYKDDSGINYSFDRKTVANSISELSKSDSFFIRLIKNDNKLIGGLMFSVTRSFMDSKKIHAHELFIHSCPSLSSFKRAKIIKKLFKIMNENFKKYGVNIVTLGDCLGDKMKSFLIKDDFKPYQKLYFKEVF